MKSMNLEVIADHVSFGGGGVNVKKECVKVANKGVPEPDATSKDENDGKTSNSDSRYLLRHILENRTAHRKGFFKGPEIKLIYSSGIIITVCPTMKNSKS